MSDARGPYTGPAVWHGPDEAAHDQWIFRLSERAVDEIEQALAVAKQTGKSFGEITAADFPLPTLEGALSNLLAELEYGRGFLLIRGVPTGGKSVEECSLIYWGLGCHLGTPVSQNAAGDLLGHVRDTGADPSDPSVRLYKTRENLSFHTDGADIIGLLCLRTGRSGGASRIASSAAVYNEVLRRRPDLAPLMFESFPFDRNEEQADGEAPYFEFPLCLDDAGVLKTFYIGWYIRDSQRHRQAPRLTKQQRELLDLIDEIAESPDYFLEMDFQPGDIQLLKNSAILHARTEYVDHAQPERKRHLLRLWLNGSRQLVGRDGIIQGGIPAKDGVASDAAP